jgi:hypothetical protein
MATNQVELRISPPKFTVLTVEIEGLSPYMQLRFSQKAKGTMKDKMEAGSTARGKRTRDARDFQEDFKQAQYIGPDGWNGIPASAFRNASIDVCRMVGFKMTHARMSIFIEADGFDFLDGTPLVKLESPSAPEMTDMAVRNATGVADIRIRPMWREWSCKLRVRFDEDQFTAEDVINLLNRAGQQVGVGEGRPFSKNSNGLGMGMFTIKNVF